MSQPQRQSAIAKIEILLDKVLWVVEDQSQEIEPLSSDPNCISDCVLQDLPTHANWTDYKHSEKQIKINIH